MRDTFDFTLILAIIMFGVLCELAAALVIDLPRALWAIAREFPAAFRE